jgi:hypothetical protein
MDRTLKTVEDMVFTAHANGETLVVVVSADFASGHGTFLLESSCRGLMAVKG